MSGPRTPATASGDGPPPHGLVASLGRALPLVRANLVLFARDPGPLVGRIAQPVLLILLLHPLYVSALADREAGVAQVVLGQLVMFSLLGTSLVGTSILTERRWRTFDRLRATPAGAPVLLVGKALPVFLLLLVQQSVVLGVGIVVLGMRVESFPLLLLADVTWTVTVLCLGAAVAMLVTSLAQFTAVVDIGATVLAGLGGALVPVSALPSPAAATADLYPTHWAMTALRSATEADPRQTLTACTALVATAALAAGIATHKLRRGWGRPPLL